MSEEINLTDSNLTTTADVFDEFQANTFYEEDDFITLADIAPPEDAIPDLRADISEIPYDNEVVLSSNVDEEWYNASDANTTSALEEKSLEEKSFDGTSICDSKNHNGDQINEETSTSKDEVKVERRRGSRKTNNTDPYVLSQDQEKRNSGRRRRKPNNKLELASLNGNQTESEQIQRGRGRRRGRGSSRRRRGRGRGGNHNLSKDLNTEDTNNIDNNKEPDTADEWVPVPPGSNEIVTQLNNSEEKSSLKGSESFVDSFANFVKETNFSFNEPPLLPPPSKGRKKRTGPSKRSCKTINNTQSTELNMSDEDGDDISLSNLKKSYDNSIKTESAIELIDSTDEPIDVVGLDTVQQKTTEKEVPTETQPEAVEYENNIEDKDKDGNVDAYDNSLLVEDTTKRPARRKAKKTFHYEEDSDEDPFANIELSDDERPRRGKKGKYNSDDEYLPHVEQRSGRKRSMSSDDSGSDIDELEGIARYGRKLLSNSSPRKRSKNSQSKKETVIPDVTNTEPAVKTIEPKIACSDDIEGCLQSSVIKIGEEKQGSDFENFLAQRMQGTNLKIKKLSPTEPTLSLEIPVIDPKEAKKFEDKHVQTETIKKLENSAQTDTLHDIPMKINQTLTTEQAEKACEFLRGVVQTTAELGQLMTQKSEDFMEKKINTTNITDTQKMDYCVKKSFLLFKLAKHNLVQMEQDLAKQYDEFLKNNGLENCREIEKKIEPKKVVKDDDSDCEIVETPVTDKKPKFNPKTVFLNKELSIKIAKKPPLTKPTKSNLNIKGVVQKTIQKNTVWISESVMVKKVNPTQSFLAMDSRNQKPPDSLVTVKMVSDFFKQYYHEQVQSICASFTRPEWLCLEPTELQCCYFFLKSAPSASLSNDHLHAEPVNNDLKNTKSLNESNSDLSGPETLFSLCTKVLHKHMFLLKNNMTQNQGEIIMKEPDSLFRLCVSKLAEDMKVTKNEDNMIESNQDFESNARTDIESIKDEQVDETSSSDELSTIEQDVIQTVTPLKWLCHRKIKDIFYELKKNDVNIDYSFNDELPHNYNDDFTYNCTNTSHKFDDISLVHRNENNNVCHIIQPLKYLCYNSIVKTLYTDEIQLSQTDCSIDNYQDHDVNFEEESLLNCDLQLQNACKLKILCYERIKELIFKHKHTIDTEKSCTNEINNYNLVPYKYANVKPLFSIALEEVQFLLKDQKKVSDIKKPKVKVVYMVKPLADICFEMVSKLTSDDALEEVQFLLKDKKKVSDITKPKVKVVYMVKPLADICFEMVSKLTSDDTVNSNVGKLTINSVNTLSEEAFHNIGEISLELEPEREFAAEEDTDVNDDDDYDAALNNYDEENNPEENDWVAQVEMKLLSSVNSLTSSNKENEIQDQNDSSCTQPEIASVKLEPVDEPPESVNEPAFESAVVKNEPILAENQMTAIHDSVASVATKREHIEDVGDSSLLRRDSYDFNQFESFVNSNKMIHAEYYSATGDEIFSQSALRVRRQYDPDSDHEEPDTYSEMSLLVPQTFEPLYAEHAKDCLMESSSDESSSRNKTGKKKNEKRRGRPRKNEQAAKDKVVPQPQPPQLSDVARLTRRMKERIRQEEKKIESSDSETEISLPLNARKDKERKGNEKTKEKSIPDDEIQCNNVDSTEQIENNERVADDNFTGFSAIDQNEISTYQKYVKYVYDKIMPTEAEVEAGTSLDANGINTSQTDERPSSPLIHPDEPVEMIECVPSMPEMFDNSKRKRDRAEPKSKNKESKIAQKTETKDVDLKSTDKSEPTFVERHGWQCYPIDNNDKKLHELPAIVLNKLPESFVQTYFRYQNITSIRKEDQEVDKLTNLQTLKKSSKEVKRQQKGKQKQTGGEQGSKPGSDVSRGASPDPELDTEYAAELTPSEDEKDAADEAPPAIPLRQNATENHLAKNLLMNDESDEDTPISKIKQEKGDDAETQLSKSTQKKKTKASPLKSEDLMLTADKMMNKELNLLHAPVNLDNNIEASTSGTSGKSKSKKSSKRERSRGLNVEEDSSSEEEKQWVSTKEKLLKRMGKKQDTTVIDDAKRAKLVNEFIERRGDGPTRKRQGGRGKRRASRLMIEREKQLRVLSKELYGDGVDLDAAGRRKIVSHSLFKGRRNIRKVIDKKSLARSTVIANMEEFERKRRLLQKLQRQREELRCEDDVNVFVINGEVCLEYDFERHRPLVSVHPFFTKVMKSHQYEGVKFMWDACFESLEMVASGHPGGGCILAHCMGLGKTLQVLALLHTVLTHPRVGMQRILVCCPLSTVLNWVDEIHKWIGPVTDQIKVFELSKLKKTYERAYQLEDWYNGGGIFIIGYELFRSLSTLDPLLDDVRPTIVNKIRSALLDPGPDVIVCDEGHLLKNDCSVLAVAMSRVQTKRRIVLTGTPMQNNLREYYCMVNFIKPNLLGTYSEYSNRFENPIMNGQHRDSHDEDIKLMKQRTHILHKVLEGCLQRQEASVLYPYLPKKHEYTLFISLTKCQWDLYKHYMTNYANQSKQSILKDFHILQKIWSHPQVLHNFQMRTRDEAANKIKPEKLEDDLATEDLTAREDIKPSDTEIWWLPHLDGGKELDTLKSSNKFLVVFRILEECIKLGDKVLIFSTSLITMDSLEFFLKKINNWSLGQDYYRLDGSVPAEVRQKWCREFNAENNVKTKLFLISTRAGSLGLNMVAANRVIILDTSWNPAHDIQSIFRVYRFGQKKDCYIYRLVALGTMEQKIYERSVTKQAVACRVVDEQQIDRHYNSAELTELYKYDSRGWGVVSGVAVGVCDVALLRVARAPCVHAVHEHDSLLRGSTESQLTELERRDAWLQFQEEHANKQIQNQLTSSFALHISTDDKRDVILPPLGIPPPETTPHVEVNTKTTPQAPVVNAPSVPEPKGKKGKKKKVQSVTVPVQQQEPPQPEDPSKKELPVEENVVKKIMKLLVKHNIHNHQEPKEIAALIANVRRIVSYGQMPQEGFNCELTQSIANVLLGKDQEPKSTMPPLTNVETTLYDHSSPWTTQTHPVKKESHVIAASPGADRGLSIIPDVENTSTQETGESSKKSRGRRKKVRRGRPKKAESGINDKPTTLQAVTATPTTEESEDSRQRRKAALAAEKQLGSFEDSNIIDLDDDDDDWQADDTEDSQPPVELPPKETAPKEVNKKNNNDVNVNLSKKQLESAVNSILLSDDDEPQQPKKIVKLKIEPNSTNGDSVNIKSEPQSEEVIPLHPSLLTNKNFIKIVAHTYLEGNPMLDEDAALLAAQYSTQKALKEYEATGNKIESGPIYDIAKKVLGIDILKKLQKTNPTVITSEKPAEPTPQKSAEPKPPMPVAASKTEASFEMEPESGRRAGPGAGPGAGAGAGAGLKPRSKLKLKPKGISELMPPPAPTPAPARTKPISLAGNTTTTKFAVASNTVVPVGLIKNSVNITPEEPEESILPDDEVRIVTDEPTPARPPPPTQKPIILNNRLPGIGYSPFLKKIKVTDGKLVLELPGKAAANARGAAAANSGDTICLDSDDDEPAPPPPPPPHAPVRIAPKRVALKSTAKKQPVPVSVTATNPILADMIQKPRQFMPMSNTVMHPSTQNVNPTDSHGVVLIPHHNQYIEANFPRVADPPGFQSGTPDVNTSGYMNSMPQVVYASSVPQITGYLNQSGQPIYVRALPQNVMSSMPQNHNIMSPMMQNVNVMNSASQMAPIATSSAMGQYSMPQYGRGTAPAAAPPPPPPPSPPPPPAPAPATPHRDDAAPPPPKKPTAVSSLPKTKTKTVCKPGDILRITKTGQVEILNRDEDESPTKNIENPLRREKSPEIQRKRSRARKLSTSSSSDSDNESEDPLAILKDVVHIKAVDDDVQTPTKAVSKTKTAPKNTPAPAKKPFTPQSLIGNTSIQKSSMKINTKPVAPSSKGPECTIKKLDTRLMPIKSMVDLTDLDTPSTSKVAAKPKEKPKSSLQALKKEFMKNSPSKITGKSKDIIINSTGKALSAATNASGKKAITVTNVEVVPPRMYPAKPSVKRQATSVEDTSSSKKPKKSVPMTLKDFDIDDIDDIIELD